MLTTENGNGTAVLPDTETKEHGNGAVTLREAPNGRNGNRLHVPAPLTPALPLRELPAEGRQAIALFCYDTAGTAVGKFLTQVAEGLARRGLAVHVFTRRGFELAAAGIDIHILGDSAPGELLDQVQEFTHNACNAFLHYFPNGCGRVPLVGFEWSTIPVLSLLHGIKGHDMALSLTSLERQRSDMSSELSQRIEAIELSGLREARAILVPEQATAEVASFWVPHCADRIKTVRQLFPIDQFQGVMDPGAVKARYQVGPVDPTILYVGDLSESYGPDLLMKAFPTVLKQHKQARLIVAGEGALYWPLRVYARYLLLEHAVRLVGSVEGQAMQELIQSVDMVVVPSRESTPWWPVLAGWASRRPIVASHEAAAGLLEHEQDSILCYPTTQSFAWGIDRILSNPDQAQQLARNGRKKLEDRFGWNAVAAQLEELIGAAKT